MSAPQELAHCVLELDGEAHVVLTCASNGSQIVHPVRMLQADRTRGLHA